MQGLKNDGNHENGFLRKQSDTDRIRGPTESKPRPMPRHESFQTLRRKQDELQ